MFHLQDMLTREKNKKLLEERETGIFHHFHKYYTLMSKTN